MIKVTTIASGSSGNCYKISDSTTTIMIEAGIRFQAIREAFSFQLSRVAGCLLSHCHGDHSKAIKDLMKVGKNCYMSQGTADALNLSGHRLKVVKSKEVFTVGTFKILPFDTQHDAADPLGFLLQSKGGEKLLFATDTYYLKYNFTGVNYYMIECNYSKVILEENIKSGAVPAAIRNRILKSHFELENVKKFLQSNDLSKAEQIHLIHISGNNGDKEMFKKEIQKITGKQVFVT